MADINKTAAQVAAILMAVDNATNGGANTLVTSANINSYVDGIFVVNLTPTSANYSGTMDKTSAEIYAAYQNGDRIVFRVWMGAGEYVDADCSMKWIPGDYTYPSFNAFVIDNDNDLIIMAWTGGTNDGTNDIYYTTIYALQQVQFN